MLATLMHENTPFLFFETFNGGGIPAPYGTAPDQVQILSSRV